MEYKGDLNEAKALIGAIDRSNAIIEFIPEGEIIDANAMFLQCMGYTIDEIRGKHHRIFVDPKFAASSKYKEFWAKLKSGQFSAAEYMRLAKGGREVWLQATYNPVLDVGGKVVKVIKLATDITDQKLASAIATGKICAVEKSMAVIEFNIDGTILKANKLFLECMGYEMNEIEGKHHRIFVDPDFAASPKYTEFWAKLNRGEYNAAEYKRLAKGGREVWLQATYNPVLDASGKVFKVVKLATDITDQKRISANDAGKIEAVEKSMAVIEFNTDGTIIRANDLFLDRMGYEAQEIEGKHHRIFVDKEFAGSQAYAQFWVELAQGKFNRGRFERFDKAGEAVWLEATYSPIFDPDGKPVKVVKFAYDITAQVRQGEALEAALAEAQEAEKMRNELDRAVQEMSTPVTPIWEGILLLPLVGVLDSMRTSDIMNKSLSMISEMRAKVFVLDISGVATVDTAVANQLIKITKATRLMGCEAIVSGLSPAIARTIVELGVNVEAIRTTATLRDAFEKALVMVGESLIGKKAKDSDAHKGK